MHASDLFASRILSSGVESSLESPNARVRVESRVAGRGVESSRNQCSRTKREAITRVFVMLSLEKLTSNTLAGPH